MNRDQRRARGHSGPQPIILGQGIVATPTGRTEEAIPMAELPEKEPGKHRWVASVAYVLSQKTVESANDAKTAKFLDHENMLNIAIGCWDCERVLGEIAADSICEAEADG